ncbi:MULTISPECIES: nitroreductase family protein [Allobranchiibius]|uniref:Nitroreductase n=1 Tax=Allobranchiibius huperziae TaxID=1874116 RepID=A0A853DJF6_9MICO|nr:MULTISPECIES: nitroreductase family protein [Allobranchiibius]NYJ76163.1 nitroreductase [Allobranchiibius huperziae]UIJ35741.1 nitroreductase family protein [Allobranchiibius sp. GilTou73]
MTASPTSPQILDLLRERRSPSVFDPTYELSDEQLASLLEAARWSPSNGNAQPWAFVVARRGDAAHEVLVGSLSRGNSGWVPPASAVLVTAARTTPERKPALADYARYDLGQAVAHLCVQAASMGLGVHQFGGFDHEALAAAYEVPDEWSIVSGIAVGRPWPVRERSGVDPSTAERELRERHRKPFSEFAFGSRFGEPLPLHPHD